MRDRSIAVLLALMAFWAFAWVTPQDPANVQVITRLAMTLSIVENGTLDIDKFAQRTIDKALVGDHYYTDKPPGHPLLAVPSVFVAKLVFGALGWQTDARDRPTFARYAFAATLGVNGLLSALAVAALFLTARKLGAGQAGGVFASGVLALGTPFYGWSSAFFAHSVSASLLLIALALIVHFSAERPVMRSALAGLVMSYTAVVDLTAAPTLVVLGLLALFMGWRAYRLPQVAIGLAIGGVVGALPLFVYNAMAFGSPLVLGYSNVVGWEGMRQGIFGVGLPDPVVTLQLLIGLYRGLLPLTPILLMVPAGLWAMAKMPSRRPVVAVLIAAILIQLTINSGYYYWTGGWSLGPRHLVPALPFAALALAWLSPKTGADRTVIAALLGLSLVLSLATAAGGMFAPDKFANPLLDWTWPKLQRPSAFLLAIPPLLSWLAYFWLLRRVSPRAKTGSSAALQDAVQ